MAKIKKITDITYVNPQGEVIKEKLTGKTGGYKASDLSSGPALATVAQTVKPTVTTPTIQTFNNDIRTLKQPQTQVAQTSGANPLVTAGKTAGNIATNMGTGALKTLEGVADTASDLIFNPIERKYNYIYDFLTKGKKVADENAKDLYKMQQRDIKRDMTKDFQDTVGWSDYVNDWEKDSLVKRGNFGGQVAQGVGGMVPSLIMGQAFGGTPELADTANLAGKEKLLASLGNVGRTYAAQLPSNLVLGASSYGSGVEEALGEGASMDRARLYGLTNAGIEQVTEMLTGGVPGLQGKGGIDNYIEPLIDRNARGYGKALLKAGYGALGEGLEESASTYLGALAQQGILGKDIDWNQVNQEALQSGLLGSTTGAILNTPSNLQNISEARAENAALRQQKETQKTVEPKPVVEKKIDTKPIQEEKVKTQQEIEETQPVEKTVENIAEKKKEPVIKSKEFKKAQEMVKKGTATEKERSYIKTATESQNTQEMTEQMNDTAKNYQVQANEQTLMQAEAKLKGIESLEDKAKYVSDALKSDKRLNASDMAAAELVLKDAAAAKNTKVYNEVLADLSIYATEQGQSIQALSMIRKLSPTSQLDVLEKIINREKASGNKAYQNVEVTEEMKNRIFDCYDENGKVNQEQFDQTMEEIKQELADEIKVSAGDKVRAWRYLSMLGNPKTHVRNVVANLAMNVVKNVKDKISAAGQDIFITNKANKTATLKTASKDVKNLTNEVYNEVSKDTFGNKYNEKSDLEDRSKIFKTRWLEAVRKFNDKALSKEDQYFKKLNFKRSFSNYLTAQGISTQEDIKNNPQIVQKARLFAIEEANVATFNQQNRLAQFINSGDKKLGPAYKVIRGAIIPFTRTPLNIAKTGIEYTPGAGMLTLANEVSKAPADMKGTVLIDGLSKQITGSALALLGYALAKSGIVTAGTGKDKEEQFEVDQGSAMNYSIKLGDTSYDLSWLSPSSMPFFVGARMFEVLDKQEGINENLILESIASTLDPLSEMSCISSFTKVLQSYNQEGGGALKDMAVSTMQNYLSQFVPTVSGQFARYFDDTKRQTTADKNAPNKITQETYRSLAYKIPGLRNTLPESTDYLGREKKEYNEALVEKTTGKENPIDKFYNAFISPVNKRRDTMDKEGKELLRVARKTGNDDIIPSALSKTQSVTYNDNEYSMTRKEYNEYKKDFGNTFLDNVKEIMKTDEYKDASDEEKAQMLSGVMKYSKDKAKDNFLTEQGEDYSSTSDKVDDFAGNDMSISDYYALKVSSTTKVGEGTTSIVNGQNAKKNIALVDAFDIDASDYLKYSYEINQIKADKDSNGKSINGSAKRKKIEYIQSLPLSATQKQMLYSLKVDGTKNKKTNSSVIQTIENSDLSAEEKKELYNYIYK